MQSFLGAFAIALMTSSAGAEELDAAWFRANYLPAEQKLEKAYGECSGEVLETVTDSRSDDFNKASYSFAFDGTRRKFDRTIENHKDGSSNRWSRSIVASPEVSFSVLTKHQGKAQLERVNRSPLGFAQATAQIDGAAADSIYAPFALLGETVTSWMKHKGFEINRVARAGDTVRLDFHCLDENREFNGWISFLPDRQWVIDRWDVTLKSNMGKPDEYSWRYATTVRYGSDVPVPAVTGMTVIGYHPDWTETDDMIVQQLTFGVPVSEFKLSNYGYDDRIGLQPRTLRSLWFWLAVAGVACLVAAFVIRHVISRRAAA